MPDHLKFCNIETGVTWNCCFMSRRLFIEIPDQVGDDYDTIF